MLNNVSRQNSPALPPPDPAPRGRGRPRQWEDAATRQREYATRRRERTQRLEELYRALVNAHWEEPELARIVAVGTEAEVLAALTAHFRERPWQRRP